MMTNLPPLLPKPSFFGYAAEVIRGITNGVQNRRNIFIVVTLFFAVAAFAGVSRLYQKNSLLVFQKKQLESTNSDFLLEPTILVPTPTPLNTTPAWFIVPKLNIDTSIEQVGQTKNLQMDVPKVAANVAWYVYGSKPGDQGNVVINGHYDTPSGRPAVFYSLHRLVQGDEVKVISVDGIETVYTVVEKKFYPLQEFPDAYVFHTKQGKNLNIITCAGIWNTTEKIYNQRLVIYTTLKEI